MRFPWQPPEGLAELCRKTGGIYRSLEAGRDVGEAVYSVFALMQPRYSIRCHGLEPDARLRLQLHTPEGWTEGESLEA